MNLSIEDLKKVGSKTVIQCQSDEEWEYILKLFDSREFTSFSSASSITPDYKNPCYCPSVRQYCSRKYYEENGYIIIQYADVIATKEAIYEIF